MKTRGLNLRDVCVCNSVVGCTSAIKNGAAGRSYCIEMTSGKPFMLPYKSTLFRWERKPRVVSQPGRCNMRGVLRIQPPKWSRSVTFLMTFENATGYSFNIADSPTNNGYGAYQSKASRLASIIPTRRSANYLGPCFNRYEARLVYTPHATVTVPTD